MVLFFLVPKKIVDCVLFDQKLEGMAQLTAEQLKMKQEMAEQKRAKVLIYST
jgi:hypothetical protein